MRLWELIISARNAWLRNPFISISESITETGYSRVRDIITLIDAICDTYDNSAYLPLADGTTFCNISVSVISATMGCKDFYGKTADEIVAFLETSQDWEEVDIAKAQDMANQGSLLIAGLDSKGLDQAHGHVVVIRPGKPCYSGKYGGLAPRCINIGAENFLARGKRGTLQNQPAGLNEAFVPLPKIWAWKQSL